MKSSEIIFCEKFKFFDGFVKEKYFVVLNDPQPNENFLVALTTSQELYAGGTKKRPAVSGCHALDGCFFITKGTEWFPEPTWVCFDFHEFDQQEVLRREQRGDFKRKSSLALLKFTSLIDCIKHSFDITPNQIKLLPDFVKIPR